MPSVEIILQIDADHATAEMGRQRPGVQPGSAAHDQDVVDRLAAEPIGNDPREHEGLVISSSISRIVHQFFVPLLKSDRSHDRPIGTLRQYVSSCQLRIGRRGQGAIFKDARHDWSRAWWRDHGFPETGSGADARARRCVRRADRRPMIARAPSKSRAIATAT